MALIVADRVQETTTTTGTGTYTLAGAKDGFQSFAAVGDGNTCYYAITDGTDWETGIGTFTLSGTTLARTTIIESSNSDAAVNWGAGSKDIFVTAPADKTLLVGRNLYADNPSSPTAPSATGTNGIAIGDGAQALNFDDALAIGASSLANNTQTQAVGRDTSATGSRSSAFGRSATASNSWSTAVGYGPTASGTSSLALGRSATAAGDYSTAITNSYASGAAAFAAVITNSTSSYGATGANSVAIGQLAKATATNSIAIGDTATSTTANQIALGGTTDTVQISGAYTLPTSDGTNGQVLTTDGAGAVTFADAGGGADLYAANESSPTAQPSATGANAIAIGEAAVASGTDAFAIGSDTDSTGTMSTALGKGAQATANYSLAIGLNANATAERAVGIGNNGIVAGATYSTAIGHHSGFGGSTTATGSGSMALGGSYASGIDSFAAAIANNTSSYGATGANSIAMGYQAKATNTGAVAIGYQPQATGLYSIAIGDTNTTGREAVGIGESNTASGLRNTVIGYSSTGTADYSTTLGVSAADQGIKSRFAFSGSTFNNDGDSQHGMFPIRAATTDATATALTTDGNAASTNNQIILPNNSAYSFSGTIIARQQASAGSDYASWEIKGALLRDANAASTVLGNGIVNKLYATSGASAWAVALSADTTNGGLRVEVTGAAATNIRWVATVNTSEVTYA